MSVGLKHGFFWGGEVGEPEIEARVTAGAPKKKDPPKLPDPVSPLDYRRGWREHIRAAEAKMWVSSEKTQAARQVKPPPERTIPERPHKKAGLPAPTRKKQERDPVQSHKERMEANRPPEQTFEIQPSEKQITRRPKKQIRRPDERLEASNKRAAEVREENRFKAHLKATEGIVKSQNIKEEKRQRKAEKEIGYLPTQIKRDRSNREKQYELRTKSMVNLEKAKRSKAKLQDVEDLRNKQRLEALKKARAAKKRKAKKKKK